MCTTSLIIRNGYTKPTKFYFRNKFSFWTKNGNFAWKPHNQFWMLRTFTAVCVTCALKVNQKAKSSTNSQVKQFKFKNALQAREHDAWICISNLHDYVYVLSRWRNCGIRRNASSGLINICSVEILSFRLTAALRHIHPSIINIVCTVHCILSRFIICMRLAELLGFSSRVRQPIFIHISIGKIRLYVYELISGCTYSSR